MTDDGATMTLLEHLEELRRRLIVSAIAIGLAGIAGFFLSEPIIALLRAPLPDPYDTLIVLTVGEVLGVRLRIALIAGLAMAMPVVLYEIYAFVTPGLTPRERRFLWPLLALALFLFALGLVIGYLLIPFALSFLLSLTLPGTEPTLRLSDYVGFVTLLLLAFGLALEFPIVLLMLARAHILGYRFLASRRRWAVLLIVAFAIVATPGGDPLSPLILSLVMYGLFEGTLQLIRLMGR